MTPRIRNTASYKLNIPTLSGGVNLRDGVSLIQDNQLTECKNLWFKNGMLRTRPGLSDMKYYSWVLENFKKNVKVHDVYRTVTGEHSYYGRYTEECRLISFNNDSQIKFFWASENVFEEAAAIDTSETDYFVVQNKDNIYCFLSNRIIYSLDKDTVSNQLFWEKLNEEDLYAPLIMTNGLSTTDSRYGSDYWGDDYTGDMIEPYNMLTSRYTAVYSTVNKNLLNDDKTSLQMVYSLPIACTTFEGRTFKATITKKLSDGATVDYEHSATGVHNGWAEESAPREDNLRMIVYGKSVVFYSGDSDTIATLTEADYLLNNLEITTYGDTDSSGNAIFDEFKTTAKVFKMSKSIWFGGGAKGISGGSRLFLCGNTDEKNLVVWSDLDNPLYFPENNYFYVGNSNESVTAFGKQSDMLVIFKENETYYTKYLQNTDITAEDIINQTVTDYIATSAYFPLVQINATIGCDCPDTVQLCRNRLVWANSNGKVYTLVSNNQYSERNIFEVGEMIHNRLKKVTDLKNSYSLDWNGHFLLVVNAVNIYALDYNSYGFNYVSSYSKTEDANLRIPWYFFELPEQGFNAYTKVFTIYDNLIYAVPRKSGIIISRINEDSKTDTIMVSDPPTSEDVYPYEAPIPCEMQTKLFDFGQPTVKKNIPKIELSFGSNGAVPITVQIITEQGTEEHTVVLDESTEDESSPAFFADELIRPIARNNKRIALKISSDGGLFIGPVSLQYKMLGGIK